MLFDVDIDPCCVYCHFGTNIGCEEVACYKRGIMSSSGYCSAFRYEPTKRQPYVGPHFNASSLSEQDFALLPAEPILDFSRLSEKDFLLED